MRLQHAEGRAAHRQETYDISAAATNGELHPATKHRTAVAVANKAKQKQDQFRRVNRYKNKENRVHNANVKSVAKSDRRRIQRFNEE